MKQTDLSRRAFLLGLGAVSSAALLSACNTNAPVNSGPTPFHAPPPGELFVFHSTFSSLEFSSKN